MKDGSNITDGYEKMKSDLKTKDFFQKVRLLWSRHKGFWTGVLAVSLLIALAVKIMDATGKTTELSGIAANVQVSDSGVAYLREEFRDTLDVTSDRHVVYFNQSTVQSGSNTATNENYYTIQSIRAFCNNAQLDYMILDQEAFELMLTQKLLTDLRELLTEDQLQEMSDMLEYFQTQDSETVIPIALDITHTPFIRENAEAEGKVYFVFAAGSPRAETCRKMLFHLLAWTE